MFWLVLDGCWVSVGWVLDGVGVGWVLGGRSVGVGLDGYWWMGVG